jgi:hypothetical protein
MTPRTQNLLSVGALAAALVITLLPESSSTSTARAASAPIQVSQLAR